MNIQKKEAVEFFQAVGFTKADQWPEEKLKSKLVQAKDKLKKEKIPSEFLPFFALVQKEAEDATSIAFIEEPSTMTKKELVEKLTSLGIKLNWRKYKVADLEEELRQALQESEEAEPQTPKKVKKRVPSVSSAEAKKADVEKDDFGCRVGTISNQVNEQLSTKKWVDLADICKETGLSLDQVRGRLYVMEENNLLEKRRRIEYRLRNL